MKPVHCCAAVALTGVLTAPGLWAGAPDPVAAVGDRPITRARLDEAVNVKINSSYYHRQVSGEALMKLRREALAGLIRSDVDLLGGLERGLTPDLEGARRRCAAMEAELGTDRYEEGIAERGWSREDHAEILAETTLAREARHRFIEQAAAVTDDEVRAMYEGDLDRWRMPASIHLWHILLMVESDQPEEAWRTREDEARELLERLEAGEPFSGVARTESEDAFRVKGGDLGWVHRGQLVPDLENLAWSLEPGAFGGPVRSPDGVHVVMVSERREARQLSFEEAASSIREAEQAKRLADAERSWFGEVTKKHPVAIFDPELEGALD